MAIGPTEDHYDIIKTPFYPLKNNHSIYHYQNYLSDSLSSSLSLSSYELNLNHY